MVYNRAVNEAESRIVIDKMLRVAGWRLPGDESPNVRAEQRIAADGRSVAADYVLQDGRNFPLAVLEAKSGETDALAGKEQAREYAKKTGAPFVILSNGKENYFWEVGRYEPVRVPAIPSQAQLERRRGGTAKPCAFLSEKIGENYIFDAQGRDTPEHKRRRLRDYQIAAVQAVQRAADSGVRKFLLEMATGTGKTLVSAALIKLFLATGNARRVLFVVDRLELEEQARANFVLYFGDSWRTVVYKENWDDWSAAPVVVSTVQSLTAGERYKTFSPLDFDLLIVDEAHRAIGGSSARRVFEYFCACKLGLTATPKDYLSHSADAGIFEREKRLLRDTYRTFGCEPGEPTFRYDLNRGAEEGHLIRPRAIVARTEITTQMLSDEGFSFDATEDESGRMVGPDGGGSESGPYYDRDFEKKFFSEETNKTLCRAFLRNAIRDPVSGDIGKSVLYCVSQRHAAKVAAILNEFAAERFPEKYSSDFAMQITSQVAGAAEYAKRFANNTLGGKTPHPDGYDSCKTRVCVTVGMMTTGYDCPDILNIGLMRPVFSPSEFIQMRGRGTRPHAFEYGARKETKREFVLFDFFAVCEYFEKNFPYDRKLPLTSECGEQGGDSDAPFAEDRAGAAIYTGGDGAIFVREILLVDGMRVDENLYSRARKTLEADSDLRDAVEQNRLQDVEKICGENYATETRMLRQTAEQFRRSLDRGVDIGEVLRLLFGVAKELPDREAILNDETRKFVDTALEHSGTEEFRNAAAVFKACLHDSKIAEIVEERKFGELSAQPSLDEETCLRVPSAIRDKIIRHIKTEVNREIIRKLAV